MDPRFADYYGRELQHLRSTAAEFAAAFPKIAQRLSLDTFGCRDPYVERLLEGFAFLAARVQLKLDSQVPDLSRHLFDVIHPGYLAPLPAMAVVALQPNVKEGIKADGVTVPRGTALNSITGPTDRTPCEFRTAQDCCLWPLELVWINYLDSPAALRSAGVPDASGARAGIQLSFKIQGGLAASALRLDTLDLQFCGVSPIPALLFEAFHRDAMGFYVRDNASNEVIHKADRTAIQRRGLLPEEAMLPEGPLMFSGYRLLREFFAMPERFLNARLTGMRALLGKLGNATRFEIIIPLCTAKPGLTRVLEPANVRLHCVPVINLFPHHVDRILLDRSLREHHVVVDKTRPQDFEIHTVTEVEGCSSGGESLRKFTPFFATGGANWHTSEQAYFTQRREPRVLSARERAQASRANYYGSEVFLSLVDYRQKPFSTDIHQLNITALVTNRDLPLQMPLGRGHTDFEPPTAVESCRCVIGPTHPVPGPAQDESTWRLVSFLSLNYLALCDEPGVSEGAARLRELLMLHSRPNDAGAERLIGALRGVISRPRVQRLPVPGLAIFARGTQIELRVDDTAFEGSSSFLLGSILEEFFRRYTHVNSFTETVLVSIDHGETARWPARLGTRATQ